jgi:hypothetical protein
VLAGPQYSTVENRFDFKALHKMRFVKTQPTFRIKMPPSSDLKNKPNNKKRGHMDKQKRDRCLAYFSILKMEAK